MKQMTSEAFRDGFRHADEPIEVTVWGRPIARYYPLGATLLGVVEESHDLPDGTRVIDKVRLESVEVHGGLAPIDVNDALLDPIETPLRDRLVSPGFGAARLPPQALSEPLKAPASIPAVVPADPTPPHIPPPATPKGTRRVAPHKASRAAEATDDSGAARAPGPTGAVRGGVRPRKDKHVALSPEGALASLPRPAPTTRVDLRRTEGRPDELGGDSENREARSAETPSRSGSAVSPPSVHRVSAAPVPGLTDRRAADKARRDALSRAFPQRERKR